MFQESNERNERQEREILEREKQKQEMQAVERDRVERFVRSFQQNMDDAKKRQLRELQAREEPINAWDQIDQQIAAHRDYLLKAQLVNEVAKNCHQRGQQLQQSLNRSSSNLTEDQKKYLENFLQIKSAGYPVDVSQVSRFLCVDETVVMEFLGIRS